MVKSVGWQWNMVDDDPNGIWKTPDPVVYYLQNRWQSRGFTSFLDLGCGLGRHSVLMAKNGFQVKSFDISYDAVSRTAAWAEKEGISLDTRVGDMLELPYEDGSADCILCYNVISHTDTEGVKKVISEIFRVLKCGGEVYLTVASQADWGFSCGAETVDGNTRLRTEEGPEYMIPHFYCSFELAQEIFSCFKICDIKHIQTFYSKDGKNCSSYHYHLLCRKPETEQ